MTTLPTIAAGRRRADAFFRGLAMLGTGIALVPLVLVLFFVIKKGIGSWSGDFFTQDPTLASFGAAGGIKSALLGTIEIVAIAAVIAIPIGLGVALYLVEFGKEGRFASVVRYFIDVLTGVPSIIFGLFVFIVLVLGTGGTYAAWKGSIALALLMLPIVTRSAEVVLLLVPNGLRESALALGAPRWRVVLRIVLPTALPGLITGSILAIARAAGETAPLLFVTPIVVATTGDPTKQMDSIPLLIFNNVSSASPQLVSQAWGAALTLVVLLLLLTLLARLIARRSRLA